MRFDIADEAYARVRDLFEHCPELFSATRDGLVVPLAAIDEHVIGDGITRSAAVGAGLRDSWLLRTSRDVWVLLPHAFGIEDGELPAFVQDRRGAEAHMSGSRECR